MSSRIPQLLEPYLLCDSDEATLTILTGMLSASTNWLLLRYLYDVLKHPERSVPSATPPSNDAGIESAGQEAGTSVVLVSFMRDLVFWSECAARLGLSLEIMGRQGRFIFVDGMADLFLPSTTLSTAARGIVWKKRIAGFGLDGVGATISTAVGELATHAQKVVLILDQPDILLVASGDAITASQLCDTIFDLRETVFSTVITMSADEPLISAQGTSLERNHAAFVLSMAHQATTIMSLRLLDTGTAKDVSGVMRITAGGAAGYEPGHGVDEKEYLYHVGGDGGVRVFEKGQ